MTLQEDYRAIREGAALARVAARGRIAVTGPDRASYLHGLLTNDVQNLQAGSGCYAAWLTPQGRMTTDMHVLESGDMILLDVPAAETEAILQRLDQFIFTEDVQLANVSSELVDMGVHGPAAPAALERVLDGTVDLSSWPQYRNARFVFAGGPIVLVRIDQLGVPGFTAYASRATSDALGAALESGGARRVSEDAVTAARIEAGYPVFGVDMDADIIPLEAGIESRAISFDKGCYVGQEVIIRVMHRGHGRVVRKLVGLRVEGTTPLPRGTTLYADGKEIGFSNSGAVSPASGSIALGYVHRDFIAPGSRVEAVTESGPRAATVRDRKSVV